MKILYPATLLCLCIHSYSLASDGVLSSSSSASSSSAASSSDTLSSDSIPSTETDALCQQVIRIPQAIMIINNTTDSIRTSPAYGSSNDASRLLKKNKRRNIPTVRRGTTGPMLLQGLAIFVPAAQGYYIFDSNLDFLQNYSGLSVSAGAEPQNVIFHARNIGTDHYTLLPDKFILTKPMIRR